LEKDAERGREHRGGRAVFMVVRKAARFRRVRVSRVIKP